MISLLPGIDATASALDAERIRMQIVAQNIANAETTRGPDGKVYHRQQVVFENVLAAQESSASAPGAAPQSIRVARIESDPSPPRWVYNPSHPDANPDGMVALPNINIHEEMVDLITASRIYEANLAVVRNARTMALQTLSIGKR